MNRILGAGVAARENGMKLPLIFLGLSALAAQASAETTGFTVNVFPAQDIQTVPIWPADCPGNCNHVGFEISNDSSTASITSFSMTIGDISYNYDGVVILDDAGIVYTLTSPLDTTAGGFRTDEFSFSYSGFTATASFLFRVDVDPDSINSYVDFRNILFNNGSAPNGSASVTFSNGQTLTAEFSENPALVDGYIYRLSATASALEIDIKPNVGEANPINPSSRGLIPVAILTTDDFDAQRVDSTTLAFGPDGAAIAHPVGHAEDVDGDGNIDLVVHFRTPETGIACGDTEATLTGQLFDGQPVEGSDTITTVGRGCD